MAEISWAAVDFGVSIPLLGIDTGLDTLQVSNVDPFATVPTSTAAFFVT